MKRFNSLKKNQDFQTVYRRGKSYANKYLVMYVMDSGREDTRIGISASKKVGNSVVRHRLKRQIRECYRIRCNEAARGYDLVIIAREKCRDRTYQEIEGALLKLMKSHHLM